jgi:hypothetical protein
MIFVKRIYRTVLGKLKVYIGFLSGGQRCEARTETQTDLLAILIVS